MSDKFEETSHNMSMVPELGSRSEKEPDAHVGVLAVEAAENFYGRYSKALLFLGIGLASYIASLDGSTTTNYLAFAASSFEHHSLISSIQVAQSVIIAVGSPVTAKLADVTSRGTAFVIVITLSVLGYVIIASSNQIGALAVGVAVYAAGSTGSQLLIQVVIADITTLKWRGLVSSLTATPFIINAFVGSQITAAVLEGPGWRWGYGMFAILVPASLSPLVVTLVWAEMRAKRLGLVPARIWSALSLPKRVWFFAQQLDIVGLVLLGAALSLILLPLTLAQTAKNGWNNGSMIAMLVVGGVLLLVFTLWDVWFARWPVITRRFLKNRSVVLGAWIGFFHFLSFNLTFVYLYSFVLVTKDWSLVNTNYFIQAQSLALTIFGILVGVAMRLTHRYKWLLTAGLAVRLLGVGLMIHSRGALGSDVELVWTQILQGIGGGVSMVASQVGAQASVPHADVAIITSVLILWTSVGAAVGSAMAGALWTNLMPDNILKHLPELPQAERDQLFGSITDIIAFPRESAVRQSVTAAYSDTMHTMLVVATVLTAIPLVLALFMPNWHLGDTQNAVEAAGPVEERAPESA